MKKKMKTQQRRNLLLKLRIMPAIRRPGTYRTNRATPYKVDFQVDRKLGQHLLKSPAVLDKIVKAAELRSTDTVLEIGPGGGALTLRLLPVARKVIAIDIDERMVAEVKKRAASAGFTNLHARYGDALREDLGKFDVCVANMPYQISAPFIFRLIAHPESWRCAVLMFQKEFCLKLLAKPGDSDYNRLSVNCQLFCDVTRVCNVAPGCFVPPPKVDSMVIKIIPKTDRPKIHFREWDGLMRIVFAAGKRTIRANFNTSSTLKMLKDNYDILVQGNSTLPQVEDMRKIVDEVLEEAGLSQGARGFKTSIPELLKLLLCFHRRHIHFTNVATELFDGSFSMKD